MPGSNPKPDPITSRLQACAQGGAREAAGADQVQRGQQQGRPAGVRPPQEGPGQDQVLSAWDGMLWAQVLQQAAVLGRRVQPLFGDRSAQRSSWSLTCLTRTKTRPGVCLSLGHSSGCPELVHLPDRQKLGTMQAQHCCRRTSPTASSIHCRTFHYAALRNAGALCLKLSASTSAADAA